MKADDWQMSKVFLGGGDVQYVLPIFQREYAWEEEEWGTLLDDVIETYHESQKAQHEHFLGSLVVIEEDGKKTLFQSYTLVDGQQRLTSVSILLCALRDLPGAEDSLNRKVNRYLYNLDVDGDLRYKILPTTKYDDRESYIAILDGKSTDGLESRIVDAYAFYKEQLGALIESTGLLPQDLFDCVLSSLYIVFIELDRTDKPYKIFESLNHRGKALTQADLVRNYIAMTLPQSRQQKIFDSDWSQIERKLSDRRETARIPELTAFLRHYLAMQLGDLPRVDQVYNRFRDRIEKRMKPSDNEFELEIQKLHRFASHYEKLLRPENESSSLVKSRLERLNILEPTTAFPLLMFYYDSYESRAIDVNEFLKILKVVENYLVRRFLAGEPTNYHNSMFTSLAHELMSQNEHGASSLESALGERNYPSDNRLKQQLIWNRLYSTNKSRRIVFVLEELSQHINAEVKLAKAGTVEHIMPQRPNTAWQSDLGADWQDVYREQLHTIGNLTVVSQPWNSKLSNLTFLKKREQLMQQGLPINTEYFGDENMKWNGKAIKKRALFLIEKALEAWPAFTEPPRSQGVTGRSPLTLTIRGEDFGVFSWRDMLLQMVNCLHEMHLLADLDAAQSEFGGMIRTDEEASAKSYRKSSAGWWIYVNHSAEAVVHVCRRLAQFCDLGDDEWSFTYE